MSMHISDFKLKDAKVITQNQLEQWYDAMSELNGGKSVSDLNMSQYRRLLVQCSIKAGWFESLPEGFGVDDLGEMRPGNVQALSKQVDALYNEIVEPDEDFILAPPTP